MQFEADHNFTLQASSPVAVAQFMVGSDYQAETTAAVAHLKHPSHPNPPPTAPTATFPFTALATVGDPAFFTQRPPTDQYRKDYTLLVPFDYLENYVSALMPTGIGLSVEDTPSMKRSQPPKTAPR